MSLISDSVIFIIDSSKAITGSGGQFTYQLNFPKGHDYDRVCLLQAIIPKSYYLVNSPYNTFTLIENGVSTTVTLTEGNYNAKSFTTIIAALLTASSSQSWTYSISFPNAATQVDTGLFTFTVSGNGGLQPSFTFPDLGVHEQFGFHAGTYSFSNNSLQSVHIVKFQVEDTLFIHSDMASNNDQSANNDVLQEIYASSTPPFSNIVYQNTGTVEAYSKRLVTTNKNIYSFNITDENQNSINFRGLNVIFTIVVYKKDNINSLVAQSLLRQPETHPQYIVQTPQMIPNYIQE